MYVCDGARASMCVCAHFYICNILTAENVLGIRDLLQTISSGLKRLKEKKPLNVNEVLNR